MKYIKSIYERLNKETYLDAIRKSKELQHFKRSSNLFQHTYRFGKFLMKPSDGMDYTNSDRGKRVSYPVQEFTLLDMIPDPRTDRSISITLKFRSNSGLSTNHYLYINERGFLQSKPIEFKEMLRSRPSALAMYRVLHEAIRDYYRDYLHDNDLDIRYLEKL